MNWILERLATHPKLSNDVVIAMPNAVLDLRPALWNNQPKLKFELGKDESLSQRLEKIEALASVAKGTYSLDNLDFWENLNVMILGDDPIILDDTKPLDQLRIAFLRMRSNVTEDASLRGSRVFQALLTNVKKQGEDESNQIDVEAAAYSTLYNRTPDEKKQLLALIGNNTVQVVAQLSTTDINVRLGRIVKTDPAAVTKAWDDPHRITRYSLRRAIANKLIVVQGEYYYLADEPTKIIASKEERMVEWLLDPEHNTQRATIERILQSAEF